MNNAKSRKEGHRKEGHRLIQFRHQQTWFWIILSLYFCLAIAYNLSAPLFEAPDENHHYAVVQHLVTTGELPVASPNTPERQEAAQPPLYYVVGALLLTPFDRQADDVSLWVNPFLKFESIVTTQNVNAFVHAKQEIWPGSTESWSVHWVRFYSTILGAGTLILIYASGRLIWPGHPQRTDQYPI